MGKQLQAFIFDLDGVITDTAEYHFLAWQDLAQKLNIPFSREFNEKLKGISRMESLEKILVYGGRQNYYSAQEKIALASQKNDKYIKLIGRLTPNDILPGIIQFMEEIKKNNLKMALASASKNAFTVIEALQLQHKFDVIVDANTIKKGKPDPEIFLSAAALLHVDASACIGIEDAAAGIDAIKAAGMFAIAVGKKEVFEKADLVVETTNELIFKEIIKAFNEKG